MYLRLLLYCLILLTCGCAKLQILPQLLTLKAVGDNKTIQQDFVERQDSSFEKLKTAFEEDKLKSYPNKKKILDAFGQPITTKEDVYQGEKVNRWLYRYSVRFFKSDKIYLYFDSSDNLIGSQYIPAPPQSSVDKVSVHDASQPK